MYFTVVIKNKVTQSLACVLKSFTFFFFTFLLIKFQNTIPYS